MRRYTQPRKRRITRQKAKYKRNLKKHDAAIKGIAEVLLFIINYLDARF